jgi:hypothetical protein
LDIPNAELLEKFDLLVDGKLKRAGALCFYWNAEKVISGCYVKIGKFKAPKHQNTSVLGALDDALVQKILEVLIKTKPEISQSEMAEKLGTTRRRNISNSEYHHSKSDMRWIMGEYYNWITRFIIGHCTSVTLSRR